LWQFEHVFPETTVPQRSHENLFFNEMFSLIFPSNWTSNSVKYWRLVSSSPSSLTSICLISIRVSELDGLLSASSPMPVQTIPQNYNSNDAIIAQQVENAGIEKLVEDKIAQQVAEKVMPEKAKCWFFC